MTGVRTLLQSRIPAMVAVIANSVVVATVKCLYILAAGTVAAWTIVTPSVLAGKPSVQYITNPCLGNFMIATGKKLSEENTYLSLSLNESACRVACRTDNLCLSAVSLVASAGSGEELQCHLSQQGPPNILVNDHPDAKYFFWEGTAGIAEGSYTLLEDGLLYLESPWLKSFSMAKNLCDSIPGHRLPIIKTQRQLEALSSTIREAETTPWLDLKLHKNGKGSQSLFWGDGTVFDDMLVANVTSVTQNREDEMAYFLDWQSLTLTADNTHSEHHLLCQANSSGLDW